MPKNSNTKFYLIIGILAVLLIVSMALNPRALFQRGGAPTAANINGLNNPLITQISASVAGKVTKVSGNTLTVQNLDGVAGELTASENILISDPTSITMAPPTNDLSKIKLNQNANMFLNTVNGKFIVTSITYLPEVKNGAGAPPIASNSANVNRTPPPALNGSPSATTAP